MGEIFTYRHPSTGKADHLRERQDPGQPDGLSLNGRSDGKHWKSHERSDTGKWLSIAFGPHQGYQRRSKRSPCGPGQRPNACIVSGTQRGATRPLYPRLGITQSVSSQAETARTGPGKSETIDAFALLSSVPRPPHLHPLPQILLTLVARRPPGHEKIDFGIVRAVLRGALAFVASPDGTTVLNRTDPVGPYQLLADAAFDFFSLASAHDGSLHSVSGGRLVVGRACSGMVMMV